MTTNATTEAIADEEAAELAAARVSFQLTYARADRVRMFSPGVMSGPSIPNAYGGDLNASGDWEDGDDDADPYASRTEAEWIGRYANYAINEAVHEALEWFRVDGKPWLDPHGEDQDVIYGEVNALVARLAAIRDERLRRTQ